MTNLLNSRFETYLMDQEIELNAKEEKCEEHQVQFNYEEYPEGFFTTL